MKKVFLRFLSLVSVFGGLVLVFNTILPIIHYEVFSSSELYRDDLLSPVPDQLPLTFADPYPPTDLTHASNWFVGSPNLPEVTSKVRYYNISIPKFGIKDAVVEIGGDDLKKNLIHYEGTALPGRSGNAVIFGHSTLPQFFKPDKYLTIFSKLPSLQNGDQIIVNYDGITYEFRVEEMFEVKPTDIQVLEQKYNNSYVTLITCVPPGTYLRRLVIKARLVPTS